MIIDAHTHIGFGGAIVASPEDLIRSMDAHGVGKALVFAGPPGISDCPNERLLAAIKPYEGRLHAVGSVSPLVSTPRRTPRRRLDRWLRDGRLRALKFYTGYQHFYPHNRRLDPYLDLLEEHGRPAIFHTGDCYNKVGDALLKYAHPLQIDQLAVRRPGLKIVMAHVGNPWFVDAAEVCYKNSNVYADCSGFVCGAFDDRSHRHLIGAVRHFLDWVDDDSKLLFGTDWPLAGHGSYVEAMHGLNLDDRPRMARIMGENAARLFGLT